MKERLAGKLGNRNDNAFKLRKVVKEGDGWLLLLGVVAGSGQGGRVGSAVAWAGGWVGGAKS